MDTMPMEDTFSARNVPDELVEHVAEFFQRCRNASPGTRLPTIIAGFSAAHPKLEAGTVKKISQMTARLITAGIDPKDRPSRPS